MITTRPRWTSSSQTCTRAPRPDGVERQGWSGGLCGHCEHQIWGERVVLFCGPSGQSCPQREVPTARA
eukprot:3280280-Lingulodinium_polyedra.AAC.1